MRKLPILLLLTAFFGNAHSQELTPEYFLDSLKSESDVLLENIDKFATPEYYHRKDLLNSFQRRGYFDVLRHLCRTDGLSALLAYLKMKLQIDYSLNHQPIVIVSLNKELIDLPIDWRFPADPWKKR